MQFKVFLLQDFYEEKYAINFMMHLLVEGIEQFYWRLKNSTIEEKYKTKISEIKIQPWSIYDFVVVNPSGVV